MQVVAIPSSCSLSFLLLYSKQAILHCLSCAFPVDSQWVFSEYISPLVSLPDEQLCQIQYLEEKTARGAEVIPTAFLNCG